MYIRSQVLLRREIIDGELCWRARNLDLNITAHAEELKDAILNFQKLYIGHMMLQEAHGLKPFTKEDRAPLEYWDLYERGLELVVPPILKVEEMEIHMPKIEWKIY